MQRFVGNCPSVTVRVLLCRRSRWLGFVVVVVRVVSGVVRELVRAVGRIVGVAVSFGWLSRLRVGFCRLRRRRTVVCGGGGRGGSERREP
jgi:hypothetical protein